MSDSTRDRYRDLLRQAASHCPKKLREEIEVALASAGQHGRPAKIDPAEILRLRAEKKTAAEIGELLGCSEGYVSRVIRNQAK